MTPDEYRHYEAEMRDALEHENNLINFRIQWLLTIHSFLFATLALYGDNPGRFWFGCALGFIGLYTCIAFGFAFHVGSKAFANLLNRWNIIKSDKPDEVHEIGVVGYLAPWWQQPLLPWKNLPIGLAVAWSFVISVLWYFPGQAPVAP